jgi:hypothetical protein
MAKGAAAAATSQTRRTNAVSSQNLTIQRTSRGLITITGDQSELGPIIEALMRGNSGGTQARATRRRRRMARKQPELANQATPAPQATKRRGRPPAKHTEAPEMVRHAGA